MEPNHYQVEIHAALAGKVNTQTFTVLQKNINTLAFMHMMSKTYKKNKRLLSCW